MPNKPNTKHPDITPHNLKEEETRTGVPVENSEVLPQTTYFLAEASALSP
ncbi:unnamed protein product [Haemonchus placei]|uniref:Uncharacterized protein n=1 Tax=Haemonchus placei TaxID=6290 RepID=A0A0N4W8L2_HAEPC|nr:unnamed protein product [Haemonchus placei]